jgi:hypothetical protein
MTKEALAKILYYLNFDGRVTLRPRLVVRGSAGIGALRAALEAAILPTCF